LTKSPIDLDNSRLSLFESKISQGPHVGNRHSSNIRGALRRGSADVTPSGGVAYTARTINQALGGAWFYVAWGRWCARWL